MKLSLRTALSLMIGLAGLVMTWVGWNGLINIGSCSSGGPNVSVRECPDDTWVWATLAAAGFAVVMGADWR